MPAVNTKWIAEFKVSNTPRIWAGLLEMHPSSQSAPRSAGHTLRESLRFRRTSKIIESNLCDVGKRKNWNWLLQVEGFKVNL